jgi:DNA-binding beta-propeller fold protein YncE
MTKSVRLSRWLCRVKQTFLTFEVYAGLLWLAGCTGQVMAQTPGTAGVTVHAVESAWFKPFGLITLSPAFEVKGQGRDIDSIAFWEAPDPTHTLMLVTAKANQLIEVWQYPFTGKQLAPLRHSSFADSQVNGVAVHQESGQVYVAVSAPASTVSVFSLPQLEFVRGLIRGSINLKIEPNIALLKHRNGQLWAYVSADKVVYMYNAATGEALGSFRPAKGLETMVADHHYQVIYIPDENRKTGVYAYNPDGSPHRRNGTHRFGADAFKKDAEGIVLYTCPSDGRSDNGSGLIVVADQQSKRTDFEFFHRQTWAHLGTLRIEGVANTDGIASTQRALPDYPLGLLAAVNNDTSTVGLGWHTIFQATGLSCGTP